MKFGQGTAARVENHKLQVVNVLVSMGGGT